MSHVAVIIDNLFEDSEYTEPVSAFKEKGHKITHVGLEKGKTVKGKKEGSAVVIDEGLESARPDEFDALLIPGGFSPDILRADKRAVNFARAFMETGKPVFAICHGPQLLITADVLKGRKVTGYTSIVQDLKNAGCEFSDSEVVEDGNLVSSRTPMDLPAFIAASLERL